MLKLTPFKKDFLSVGLAGAGGTFPGNVPRRAKAKVGRPIWELKAARDRVKKVQHCPRREEKDLARNFRERVFQGIVGIAGRWVTNRGIAHGGARAKVKGPKGFGKLGQKRT